MSALFIILVCLTVTLFNGKMLISTRCIHFMSKSIKKSWTVSKVRSNEVKVCIIQDIAISRILPKQPISRAKYRVVRIDYLAFQVDLKMFE